MMEFIKNSAFFGAMISLIAYEIGLILKKKFKMAIFNPLLISIICVIGVLLIFHIDYDDYNEGGKYISYLLTPATVCLAVPLYEQIWAPAIETLKGEGIEVELVQFSDFTLPNNALANGDIDLDAFQHHLYLDSEIESYGYDLTKIATEYSTHMNLFS